MKEVSLLFQNKRTLIGLALMGVLVYSSFNIQENSTNLKKITTFESGMQTCFSRVNQTYTAKLLEDRSSQYLTQNFQALTEECFAESILNVDENFKNQLANITKKLSTLASNVHWFHEDLITPGSKTSLSNGEGRDIGSRFEKIESTKDEVLEESDSFKTGITKDLNNQKNIFYVTATLLIVVMVLEYLANTRRKISNNAREIEAERELLDNGGVQSVKLGEIVRLALEQNDLKSCAKLFNNYYVHTNFERSVKQKPKNSLDALITPMSRNNYEDGVIHTQTEIASKESIEKIWNDDTIGIMADSKQNAVQELNLDTYASKVIDVLSEKLFSKGVQVDMKIDESINVKAQDEALEQILYHSINYAVNTTGENTGSRTDKVVRVNALKLGDLVAIDILSTGKGFSTDMLKNRIGIETNQANLDLDLQITQSLITEANGKMQIENRLSQTGEIVGSRIKLILKSGPESRTARLVDIKKGSKKEIMSQLSTNA